MNNKTLFHIQDGGICEVYENKNNPVAQLNFYCEQNYFEKNKHHINNFNCVSITILGLYPSFKDFIFPDFSFVKNPEAMQALGFMNTWGKTEEHHFASLSRFNNLISLSLEEIKMPESVYYFFPKIRYLYNKSWKYNKPTQIHRFWPKLERIRIDYFKGKISDLGNIPLKILYLFFPMIEDYADIINYPELETVFIYGSHHPIDMSHFSKLPKLKSLKIEKGKQGINWENFKSESVDIIELQALDNLSLLDGLPNLKGVYVEKLLSPQKKYYHGSDDTTRPQWAKCVPNEGRFDSIVYRARRFDGENVHYEY